MRTAQDPCDVLVVGTGPAGAASAIALAQRGLHVVLVDVATRRRGSPGESLHGVAAYSLRELGLWSRFFDQPLRRSYLSEIVWEHSEPRERRAIDHAWGPEFHLERERFDAWLCLEAERGGVKRMSCLGIDHTRFDRALDRFHCSIRTERGAIHVEAKALVDATGRSAAIMRRLGGRFRTSPDQLIAIYKVYDQPLAQPSVLIEAAPDGWWYTAPLPHGRSLAIWFTDATCARGQASQQTYFETALLSTNHTCERVGNLDSDTPLSVCAAGPSLTLYDPALPALAVGDAAAAFDPISGDGLCFALRSALDAAEALERFFAGRRTSLADYAAGVEAIFERHVIRRAILYDAVTRFGDAPFWTTTRSAQLLAQVDNA